MRPKSWYFDLVSKWVSFWWAFKLYNRTRWLHWTCIYSPLIPLKGSSRMFHHWCERTSESFKESWQAAFVMMQRETYVPSCALCIKVLLRGARLMWCGLFSLWRTEYFFFFFFFFFLQRWCEVCNYFGSGILLWPTFYTIAWRLICLLALGSYERPI